MLVTKGSAVSNMENTVIGPKTVVLPSEMLGGPARFYRF